LSLDENPVVISDANLDTLYNDMLSYMDDVKKEHARISEFFQDTIKELRDSFKMLE